MTATLAASPLSLFGEARRTHPAGARGVTLEERLEAAWRTVQAAGATECPVCGDRMRGDHEAARCSGCGSTLV